MKPIALARIAWRGLALTALAAASAQALAADCSAVWLSCAESLLSNSRISILRPPSTPPAALTWSAPRRRWLSISWPTEPNGPDSGSMKATL